MASKGGKKEKETHENRSDVAFSASAPPPLLREDELRDPTSILFISHDAFSDNQQVLNPPL